MTSRRISVYAVDMHNIRTQCTKSYPMSIIAVAAVVVSRNRNSHAPTYAAHAFIGRIWKDATVPLLGVV
jgi:hypothetical protein